MSSRSVLARFVSGRFSSSAKFLSEKEKAAENIYIKKIEKQKLEKLARKVPNPEEKPQRAKVGTDFCRHIAFMTVWTALCSGFLFMIETRNKKRSKTR